MYKPCDLVACDMNGMDCRDVMRLMLTVVPYMKRGSALLVVTLKLPHKCSQGQAEKQMSEAVAILEDSGIFLVTDRRWLLANSNNERTVVAKMLPK